MSWEVTSRNEGPCRCGKGTVVTTTEADDWNRTRTVSDLKCPACYAKQLQAVSLVATHKREADRIKGEALDEAKKHCLPPFLARFLAKPKKQIWEEMYRGCPYPSLGTFYAHARYSKSLEAYLIKCFERDLEQLVPRVIKNAKVEALLKRAMAERTLAGKVRKEYSAYLPDDDEFSH